MGNTAAGVVEVETSAGTLAVSPHGRYVQHRAPNGEVDAERYAVNWLEFDPLIGRVLTIADAAFTDPQQRKAVKDLLKQAIRDWAVDVNEQAYRDAGLPTDSLIR